MIVFEKIEIVQQFLPFLICVWDRQSICTAFDPQPKRT